MAWPSHIHHDPAHAWFQANEKQGWVTCPLAQCAFVRISSNPAFTPEAVPPRQAVQLLREITALTNHQFWADEVNLPAADFPTVALLVGNHQVTDAYLLGWPLGNPAGWRPWTQLFRISFPATARIGPTWRSSIGRPLGGYTLA